MKQALNAALICAVMLMAAPAHAVGARIDDNGSSLWNAFVAWITGAPADQGTGVDPNGRD